MSSSGATWSPTCFSHRVTVPSVTVSPSCGMVMSATTLLAWLLAVQAATGEREGGLAEDLRQRGVGVHEGGHLFGQRLPVDGQVSLGQELRGPRPGDVHAEDRAPLLGHDLHDPVR